MAGETIITVVGNLTADPELRYTQNGLPVANFTIASTPRTYDQNSKEWKDGEALFMRASVWREFAEHVAGSLTKGMRVIATGRLKQRSYQDREGNNRTSIELEVDEIGPSLRYATAMVTRAERDNTRTRQQPSAYQQQQDDAWAGAPADEPWATPQPETTPQERAVRGAQQQPQQQPTFDGPWATPGWSGEPWSAPNMTERGSGPATPPVANDYGEEVPF